MANPEDNRTAEQVAHELILERKDLISIPDQLEGLRNRDLGRAITYKDNLRGYILPRNRENTEHVILFANGVGLVIKEDIRPGDEGQKDRETYLTSFKPNPIPYEFPNESYADMNKEIAMFDGVNSALRSRVMVKNDSPVGQQRFQEALQTAMQVSKLLRDEREASTQKSISDSTAAIEVFLRSNPQ